MSIRSLHRTPTIPEGRSVPYGPKCTAQEYSQAIAYHARQSSAETLYPGHIYSTLNVFLNQKYSDASNPLSSFPDDYAWLISPGDVTSSDGVSVSDGHSVLDLPQQRSQSHGFSTPEACLDAIKLNIESSCPQILFLRGHPTPNWISSLGAFCYIDPELFRWFLRYLDEPNADYYFGSTPSTMSNVFRFKFFTIGSTTRHYSATQPALDAARNRAASDMRDYRHQIGLSWTLRPGDSIVRDFHVVDVQHAIIVQEITVSIFNVGKTWMAIACSDAGNCIDKGPPIPPVRVCYDVLPIRLWLPIMQYKPRCALKSRGIHEGAATPKKASNDQSLAVFPEGYGRGIDWIHAKSDRFHALADIFRLSAFSQRQVLNLLQRKITAETSYQALSSEHPPLANLMYFRELLQEQQNYAAYMLELTNNQSKIFQSSGRRLSVGTPREAGKNTSDHDTVEILDIFRDIESQAKLLQQKCTEGMTVISNNSMLTESQRAMKQAKLVTKLTVVAFVYLPFTFTCGFFGMNFKELGSGEISLWIFFAASFPLMLVTLAFYAFDMERIRVLLQTVRLIDRPRRG